MAAKLAYTAEQSAQLVAAYVANPTKETVEAYAVTFGKTVKSIVAKLSREGCYKKAEFVSKSGANVETKDATADAIGAILRMNENDIASLTKANKTALAIIFKALAESVPMEAVAPAKE